MNRFAHFFKSKLSPWCGRAGFIAAAVFVLGRMVAEPCRDLPLFDEDGMEAYSVVETHLLRKDPRPFTTAVFGSSITAWGVIPEIVATEAGLRPEDLRKLAVQGGTAFDYRNLLRRNQARFASLKFALVEINPRLVAASMEGDPRVDADIWQHATFVERLSISNTNSRRLALGDWILPLGSVRRPLSTAFYNLIDPPPGAAVFPRVASRLKPMERWFVSDSETAEFRARGLTGQDVAKRIMGSWRPSEFFDDSLRDFLAELKSRNITLFLYQPPMHPDAAEVIQSNPAYNRNYKAYLSYIDSLGIPPEARYLPLSIAECGIPVGGLGDYTHLNERGAKIFSKLLGQRAERIWTAQAPRNGS